MNINVILIKNTGKKGCKCNLIDKLCIIIM